jgi:hypothetical protein
VLEADDGIALADVPASDTRLIWIGPAIYREPVGAPDSRRSAIGVYRSVFAPTTAAASGRLSPEGSGSGLVLSRRPKLSTTMTTDRDDPAAINLIPATRRRTARSPIEEEPEAEEQPATSRAQLPLVAMSGRVKP